MSSIQALEKYTNAIEAMKAHQEANSNVFDEHKRLMFKVIDTENELRDEVAMSKEGVENDRFKVTVTPQTQTVFDEDAIRAKMPEAITEQERPLKISIKEK